ncbi:probable methyltransferase At1g27930 [Oryza brachyantha]|uniref:probable methyltransferase At1g27930 n=1 Tax=Oryza brachyantha TaxID=4533 RepID=UPI001ADCBC47|nr:probable methyltransferase At1g27930 [Oryza brachyantha]
MQISSGGFGFGGGGGVGIRAMSPKQGLTVILVVFCALSFLVELAAVNAGERAATAFVTDSAEDADGARRVLAAGSSAAAVHQVRYRDTAGEAWPLLRRARESPACGRLTGTVRKSGCHLALTTTLPREVLDARWDVLVVDGPSGAGPEEPGRMGAIYTAAALARAAAAAAAAAGGGLEAVDVAVHDVHRTVERWYAWEYLCEDNLAAAKGRLWHFRVTAGGPPDAFCSTGPAQIL